MAEHYCQVSSLITATDFFLDNSGKCRLITTKIGHMPIFMLKNMNMGRNKKEHSMNSLFNEINEIGLSPVPSAYFPQNSVTLFTGDCGIFLSSIPDEEVQLIVTSPPYNIGKKYEKRKIFEEYLSDQERIIKECVRILSSKGSICWQVGNHVDGNEIFPLDIYLYQIFKKFGLKLRNRIIWHFEHGLHFSKRFSGRYETILWLTKTDNYFFNLDAVRVPQKYPGKKYFKGPNIGKYSCNPLGKNPGDLWIIPNVEHNHPEKTIHPCQFPIELIERLVLALTNPGDLVVDPYIGVGSAAVAAVLHNRRTAGADLIQEYIEIAKERITSAIKGTIKRRPMNRPIFQPNPSLAVATLPIEKESTINTTS